MDSQEKLPNTKIGKIFVVNHRQSDDMVFSASAVGENGYFVFGNRILSLESLSNGYGLWMYGMILVDRNNKESRKACYDKMKYVIENGGNVIIFPEGYWNLKDNGQRDERHLADDHHSENWLVQDINIGAVRLAKETGCMIVPAILHYDEIGKKMCYGRRGKPITVSKDDDIFEKKNEVVQAMTDNYWYLMEKYSKYSVEKLEKMGISLSDMWYSWADKLVSDCDIDSVNYKLDLEDEKLIGKAPVVNGVTTNEDAFSHLDNIEYNHKNAFLLSKKLHGRK